MDETGRELLRLLDGLPLALGQPKGGIDGAVIAIFKKGIKGG
jgi:hypothetical protein